MPTRRTFISILFVALLTTPTTAAAVDPRFEAYVSNETVTPGQVNEVTVRLLNDAADPRSKVETAENLRVSVDDDRRPYTVLSGTQFVGNVTDGQAASVTFRVRVPADIEGGTYTLPLDLQYEASAEEFSTRNFAQIRVERRPRFEIRETSATAPVGGGGTVNVVVRNVGDRAATDARATIRSASGDVRFGESNSASRFIDSWESGETRTLQFDASVDPNADNRSYAMDLSVAYTDEDGTQGASRNLSFGVTPLAEQTFAVQNVDANLGVGREGNLAGAVVNTGDRTVRNAVVVFDNDSGSVTPTTGEYAIGDLAPGERAAFDFGARVADGADAGPRQLTLRVNYRDPNGDEVVSDSIDVPVTVGDEPRFDIANVESTLRVGEEGTLSGRVVNEGDEAVRNAVVVLEPPSGTVSLTETEYAVGDLSPGERATFSFEAEVTSEADAGQRQFSAFVRHRDADGDRRESDTYDVRVDVAPQEAEFDVTPVNATLSAGDSGELSVEITNTRDRAVTDVSAKIYPEAPLSSSDSEAFVERLDPGETTELRFGVSADGSAMEKPYPLKLDFQYEDGEGDTRISEIYRVPVQVITAEGDGLPLALLVVLSVAILGAGGYILARRR